MSNDEFELFGDLAEKQIAGTLTATEDVELERLYALSESNKEVRGAWERTCQRHWDAARD